jgi:ATP-binding cassette subfamily F protein 3
MKLIERVSDLRFYAIEEVNYEAGRKFFGLGFVREDFNRQTTEFSGKCN